VFARYNTALWPIQLVLLGLALACLVVVAVPGQRARAVAWMLALLWAWMGVAYHFAFFTAINPAAWAFGALSLVGAAVFARHAHRGTLVFRWQPGWRGVAGVVLIAYALAGYPAIGWLLGARYPAVPTFGLPCPTTIFTLGLLLFAARPVPRAVFVVPLLWACIGTVAAFSLGVPQDLGLLVAVLVVLPALRALGTNDASASKHAALRRHREA
jgi:hypothetical protein